MPRLLLTLLLAAAVAAGCAAVPDTAQGALYAQVVQRLSLESDIDQSRLTVREDEGVVSLGGFIDTLEQQQAIDEAAADIAEMDGVRRVDVNVSMAAGN